MSVNIGSAEDCEKEISEPGFVFAFFLYSHSHHNSIIEKVVSLMTRSDYIHVAIIPAIMHSSYLRTENKKKCLKIEVIDKVYTAFIGEGYKIQTLDKVMNDSYRYCFYPAESVESFYNSWILLENLNGAKYNYFSLMLALFPKTFKEVDDSNTQLTLKKNERVICSELALVILYSADPSLKPTINPRYCTPGELRDILVQNKKSVCFSSDQFQLSPYDNFTQKIHLMKVYL